MLKKAFKVASSLLMVAFAIGFFDILVTFLPLSILYFSIKKGVIFDNLYPLKKADKP